MHNFPIPHHNELIYSTVARAGVRFGITSPKRLLDEVFDNRTVIATIDIPSNLSCISNQLKNTGKYSVEELIYQHTMFPLYALFTNEETRLKIINKMKGNTKGIAHLSLGITASKIKIPKSFYFCPKCAEEQLLYGETYWSREWYLPELPCPKHHTLNILDSSPQDSRHHFQPCSNKKPPCRFFFKLDFID
ncbi:TniQ family protein [Pseudoalteromonas sp. TB64]|uniref:TniQ family protein n=1 Tax=Pseudoalteromonas sp. TB64 TaxID=1938600 RepID=UPI000415AB1C|nr:TniQ family protein [Pseudoalteromonas sp. TB64]